MEKIKCSLKVSSEIASLTTHSNITGERNPLCDFIYVIAGVIDRFGIVLRFGAGDFE